MRRDDQRCIEETKILSHCLINFNISVKKILGECKYVYLVRNNQSVDDSVRPNEHTVDVTKIKIFYRIT